MKVAVFMLIILFAYDQAGSLGRELRPEEEECVFELNLDREEIKRLYGQRYFPEDNAHFNEFVFCFCKKKGIVNSNGDVSFDRMKELALEDVRNNVPDSSIVLTYKDAVVQAADNCKGNPPTGSTLAQTAVKSISCFEIAIREAIE